MLMTALFFFMASCLVLIVTAELLVKSLTKVAFYFGMTDFIVGFMIVAIATSIPELFIGVTSAVEGNPELSLGNVLGSNIIDLTLVVGVMALLRKGIRMETKAVQTDTLYMFVITIMPLVLMLMGSSLDRFDGFLLISAFFLYITRIFVQRSRFKEETGEKISHADFLQNSFIAIASVFLLLASAQFLVKYSTALASDLLSPSILVGLFLISIGTTLPELIFGSGAILMKHKYMAFGDIIGSVVANNTLVLGTVALVSNTPIQPNMFLFLVSAFFMVVVAFLFTTFVEVEKHILWQEGVALIMLYVLFVIVVLNIRMLEISYGIQ
ncbi:MAG: sodium:calcium antiporter [Candidatus Altiarchaeia archaeon]